MTMQQMLLDMTLIANGDSVQVCWVTNLSQFAFPFIYYSLCVVKSIPLTLAVIFNILMDVLIGAIPFYIGDVLDVFKRSYVENLRLITGYIEDDKEIINKVNKKAFWTAVFIVVLCWLIYLIIS